MNTDASLDRLARIAGASYLVQMVAGVFTQLYARGSLIVAGDPASTATKIRESEFLFRIGIAADLVCYIAVLLATWALYVLLRPIDQRLAVLGVFFRVIELAVHFGSVALSLVALRLLGGGPALVAFAPGELQASAYLAIVAQGSSVNLGFIPLGLGSAVFALLLLRSAYVPRWLAWLGIVGSTLLAAYSLGTIIMPALGQLRYLPMLPMGVYEVGLGLLLLLRGVKHHSERPPVGTASQ